ncbi:tetratricopeptide repeat domain protein [Fusarium beomiforme]|uniref:Tetratricopeptide repeat domain protein n=1 Tax=Fusarium beomiforme TaxID=44412 RepID=A0A9P5AKZ8_9HYPO|nr:tetratricopeptide repeat domain protein [Fusarium beomiforme]
MPDNDIRLLALDGGGVRGLSSLMILKNLMSTIDPDSPPNPCDYFDMIGGTSTGGLIAIMLGRLRMTVDECTTAYTSLSDKVFEKKCHRVKINGQLQGRFDTAALELAVKQILTDKGHGEDALLKDPFNTACKVFVCATSKETGDTVCLTSYRPRGLTHLFDSTMIWQACRATSAATTFFDPIAIGPFQEQFVDGALGTNNPVYTLWTQAQDAWGYNQLRSHLRCLVSIGTGVPALRPVRDDVLGIGATLTSLATETEKTAEQFRRDKSGLDDEGRYYRFNVSHGLEDVGLEESKKQREIAAATGRPSDTADLEKCLLPSRLRARQTRRLFVLHGLGGVGKTQLAINFAQCHQDTFSSVFWLDGRSEDRLKRSIAGCIAKIPEGQVPGASRRWAEAHSQDELDAAVASVVEWLAQPDNGDWLLIFDNVDQDWNEQGGTTGAYDLRRYLPGDHGSVLVTTRLSRLSQLGESRRLGKADLALSRGIFERWYGGDKLGPNCDHLLQLLDGLPLALAQAASYLRETGIDVMTYVHIYNEQWDELMGSRDALSRPLLDYEQGSVWTTWTVSFREIEHQNTDATNLLRLWAFLDNKQLWHGLLAAAAGGPADQWPSWLSEMGRNVVQFLDAIRLLLQYSMIETQEGSKGSYSMHPVVHRWALCLSEQRQENEWVRLALAVVGQSVPTRETRDYWVVQQKLLPHAERLWKWMQKAAVSKLKEAEAMYKRSLEGREKALGPDHTSTLNTVINLGSLYLEQGKLKEAEAMYKRSLEGLEKALRPDHTSTLTAVNNLGNLYSNQGKLKEAEAMYKRALEGREKALGPDHTSTLNTVNNLGLLYLNQGKLKEAEAMYKRSLEGYEKALRPDHTSTLNTVINLGNLYSNQGKLKEAEAMYKRSLEGREKALGPDHTSTLDTVNNLGNLYLEQGKLKEAEVMYTRSLEGFEKALGPDHTSTLNTVNNLGLLYSNQGKLKEAEAMYKRSLEGLEKALGPDHTSTLNTVINLGSLYLEQGKLKEAEAMYKRSLEGCEKALGPDHTSTLGTVNNLGLLYLEQGKLKEAEVMYKRSLEGLEEALGPDHISTLNTVNNLGNLYLEQGKLKEAEVMYKRSLEGLEKALGPDHTSTLSTVINLGNLYLKQGKLKEAETMYKRALEGYEKALGWNHPKLSQVMRNVESLQSIQDVSASTNEEAKSADRSKAFRKDQNIFPFNDFQIDPSSGTPVFKPRQNSFIAVTPLSAAAYYGDEEAVRILLKHPNPHEGPGLNMPEQANAEHDESAKSSTIMHVTARKGMKGYIRYLNEEHSVQPDILDTDGIPPAVHALYREDDQEVISGCSLSAAQNSSGFKLLRTVTPQISRYQGIYERLI